MGPTHPAALQAYVSPSAYTARVLQHTVEDEAAQSFLDTMGYFAGQAVEERRFQEFLDRLLGRYLGEWPVPYDSGIPAKVAVIKKQLQYQMRRAVSCFKRTRPHIHWENILAIPLQDIEELGNVIKRQRLEKGSSGSKGIHEITYRRVQESDLGYRWVSALDLASRLKDPAVVQLPVGDVEGDQRVIDLAVVVGGPDIDGPFFQRIDASEIDSDFSDADE